MHVKSGKWEVERNDDVNSKKQAGLNLNLFAALSGAFSSATQKTTHKNADGSSTTTEQNHSKGIPFPSLFPFSIPFLIHPPSLVCPFYLSTHPPTQPPSTHPTERWLICVTCLGAANAAAQGQGSAYAAGNASQREIKGKEKGVEARQAQSVQGSKKKVEQVDHLGIES